MLRALFGRHKSASTWARSILHDAAEALDYTVTTIHVPGQYSAYANVGEMMRAERPDVLVMTRPLQEEVDTLPETRAVHLIRDPRDIIVSGYFSHRNSHPEVVMGIPWPALTEHRKVLRSLDKDAGMEAEIEFSGFFLDPMAGWNYQQPHVLEVKMEDLITDREKMWTLVFTHLEMLRPDGGTDPSRGMGAVRWNLAARRGTPRTFSYLRKVLPKVPMDRLPQGYVGNALDRFTFSKMSKSDRKPGEEDVNNHYRKGVPGDWRNHLTPRHLRIFRDRYGDLVERLGYEW